MVCDSLNSGIIIISNQIVFSNMQSDKKNQLCFLQGKISFEAKVEV